MNITDNTMVSLRYLVKDKQGEVIENIMDCEPVKYVQGSGKLLPELEDAVKGLQAGDAKSFTLAGPNVSRELFIDVIIDDVREALPGELQHGGPVPLAGKNGCGDGCCC